MKPIKNKTTMLCEDCKVETSVDFFVDNFSVYAYWECSTCRKEYDQLLGEINTKRAKPSGYVENSNRENLLKESELGLD